MAAQSLTVMDTVVELHAGLNDEVKARFAVKPYRVEGWDMHQRYGDIFGPAKILKEPRLDKVFFASKVIVCLYPETTFAEAMSSGVPTILVYRKRLYERHPVTLPLLQSLRSAHIVFHDATAAAGHINAIWKDPDLWWNSPDVLRARSEFRRQAADVDGRWLERWKSFVKGIE
jgi:putative transferase (TIGR04331 family)